MSGTCAFFFFFIFASCKQLSYSDCLVNDGSNNVIALNVQNFQYGNSVPINYGIAQLTGDSSRGIV